MRNVQQIGQFQLSNGFDSFLSNTFSLNALYHGVKSPPSGSNRLSLVGVGSGVPSKSYSCLTRGGDGES